MNKSLVIVESPTKAKTLKKYLGKAFIVMASGGHIKDLPPKKLGVDINNDFSVEYEIVKGKKKIVDDIKKSAKEADKIFLAPDPDREGEAIAWHIAESIGKKNTNIFRVLFSEITKKRILEAIENPTKLNKNKYEAQVTRRVLDRLVGYKISPLLWKKVSRGLSAGRVQSVALKIIVDRERERQAFKQEEYWTIDARFQTRAQEEFIASLFKINQDKIQITNEDQAKSLVEDIEKQLYSVTEITKKERKRNPQPPYITSTLQQDASRKHGFGAERTMRIAQQLYEGIEIGDDGMVGLITYMRTDSVRTANEALQEIRELIDKKYGREYLPDGATIYKTKKSAQDAHEAIRPTTFEYSPEHIKQYLQPDQYKIYKLIWNRFMASQMKPMVLDQTIIDIHGGKYFFKATGSIVKFNGYFILYEKEGKENLLENLLPEVSKGEQLKLLELKKDQHFTEPPPRFSESTLIKELEQDGIGRPSTYATIVSTIKKREYVEVEEKKLKPTTLGFVVNDVLVESFPHIINIDFTANLENELDKIEDGEIKYVQTLEKFYEPFSKALIEAEFQMKDFKKEEKKTDIICEKCGSPMIIKWARFGEFLACSSYPKCKNKKDFTTDETGKIVIKQDKKAEGQCPNCGSDLLIKRGRFGEFIACTNYPTCKFTKSISLGITCPLPGCGGDITAKATKRGKVFYGCSNYPKCTFASWNKPLNEKCPECGAQFLGIRERKSGNVIVCENKECSYKREESTKEEGENEKQETGA